MHEHDPHSSRHQSWWQADSDEHRWEKPGSRTFSSNVFLIFPTESWEFPTRSLWKFSFCCPGNLLTHDPVHPPLLHHWCKFWLSMPFFLHETFWPLSIFQTPFCGGHTQEMNPGFLKLDVFPLPASLHPSSASMEISTWKKATQLEVNTWVLHDYLLVRIGEGGRRGHQLREAAVGMS